MRSTTDTGAKIEASLNATATSTLNSPGIDAGNGDQTINGSSGSIQTAAQQFGCGDNWDIPQGTGATTTCTTNTAAQMTSSDTSEKSQDLYPCSLEYLNQLLSDKQQLEQQNLFGLFRHLNRLLEAEIMKIRKEVFKLPKPEQADPDADLPEGVGGTVTLQTKIYAPVHQHPDFNFVGRILGPRGMTVKQLEEQTGCKILVCGRGSKVRDHRQPTKSDELLHVLITCDDSDNRAQIKLERARQRITKLITPPPDGMDDFKKKQLIELAIINGTYRLPTKNSSSSTSTVTAGPIDGNSAAIPGAGPIYNFAVNGMSNMATTMPYYVVPSTNAATGPQLIYPPGIGINQSANDLLSSSASLLGNYAAVFGQQYHQADPATLLPYMTAAGHGGAIPHQLINSAQYIHPYSAGLGGYAPPSMMDYTTNAYLQSAYSGIAPTVDSSLGGMLSASSQNYPYGAMAHAGRGMHTGVRSPNNTIPPGFRGSFQTGASVNSQGQRSGTAFSHSSTSESADELSNCGNSLNSEEKLRITKRLTPQKGTPPMEAMQVFDVIEKFKTLST